MTGKHKWQVLGAALAICALPLIPVVLWGLPSPVRIHFVAKSLSSSDWRVREKAVNDLVTIGEPAIPRLLVRMRSNDELARTGASDVLRKIGPASIQGLLTLLKSSDPNVRATAADTLSAFVEQSDTIVPALCGLLTDENPKVRDRAVLNLGYMGPVAHPAVRQLIEVMKTDKDPDIRGRAAVSLGWIGPAATVALPDLVTSLNDATPSVRVTVVKALCGGIQAASGGGVNADRNGFGIAAIPSVLVALRHEDPAVREAAGMGLQRFGRESKEIVPQLVTALDDVDSRSRIFLVDAIRRIDPETGAGIER